MKALAKEHSYVVFNYDPATRTITFTEGSGWEQKQAGLFDYAVSEVQFDMAGMTHDDKTLFFEAITVQEPSDYKMTGGTGERIKVIDLITSIPFDVTTWYSGLGIGFAGEQTGGLNFEHVIYARWRLFANDLDFAGLTPVQVTGDTFGSGQPTNSDTLYSYRIIVPSNLVGTVSAGPARHLILADTKEEQEYVRIMRMLRSYELQQIDRD